MAMENRDLHIAWRLCPSPSHFYKTPGFPMAFQLPKPHRYADGFSCGINALFEYATQCQGQGHTHLSAFGCDEYRVWATDCVFFSRLTLFSHCFIQLWRSPRIWDTTAAGRVFQGQLFNCQL